MRIWRKRPGSTGVWEAGPLRLVADTYQPVWSLYRNDKLVGRYYSLEAALRRKP
jgi:hypothetical protein